MTNIFIGIGVTCPPKLLVIYFELILILWSC